MTRISFTLSSLSVAFVAALPALEVEQQQGGFVLGAERRNPYALVSAAVHNKQVEDGWVRVDEAVLRNRGSFRWYGLGVTLDTGFALGQDRATTYWDDNLVIQARKVQPGECTYLAGKLDWVFQIDGVYPDGGPFLQIIPHLQLVTYPNQPSNPLKDHQRWVGFDLWFSTPLEGIEVGTSHDWNLGEPAYRGSFGFREFYQRAPFDLSFWQVANWGSASYHNYYTGTDDRGITTVQAGAKATLPLAWMDWWAYARAEATFWIDREDRDSIKLQGRDVGSLDFSVGIEWRPDLGHR